MPKDDSHVCLFSNTWNGNSQTEIFLCNSRQEAIGLALTAAEADLPPLFVRSKIFVMEDYGALIALYVRQVVRVPGSLYESESALRYFIYDPEAEARQVVDTNRPWERFTHYTLSFLKDGWLKRDRMNLFS
jgi:hypothetical protein